MSPFPPSSQKEIAFKCLKHHENCPEYRKPAAEIESRDYHSIDSAIV